MDGYNEGFPIGMILFDRYRIEREIGGGGMSYVYFARDEWQKDTFVVVKTPIVKLLQDKWILKKFKQEAESLVRLNHQGIVKLLGHGEYQNQFPFVILEFVDGKSLFQLMPEFAADKLRTAKLIVQITEAVEHAHSHDIFHRDLKPENIMVENVGTSEENIKLIDFGIARITNSFFASGMDTRHQVGTPFYISPNRLRQDPNDRADDIYALGLIFYEMVTGKNPLGEAQNFDHLKRLQENIPPPRNFNPYVPVNVERELLKALSKHHTERHHSVKEFGKIIADGILDLGETKRFNLDEVDSQSDGNISEITISFEKNVSAPQFDEAKFLNAISDGERFLLNGDFDSAIAFYDEKIEQNDISDLLYIRRAMGLLLKKDYDKAALDCQKAIKLNEVNDFAYLIRGIIYRLKLWTAEAKNDFSKAIQINPNNIMASLLLGDIHSTDDEKDTSLNYYAHVCRVNPHFSWVYSNRGNLFYDKQDYQSAVKDFTMAIQYNPELAWNYYRRAKCFQKINKPDEALRDFTDSIKLNPKNPTYYNERAKVLFNMGRNQDALADFNQVKELSARDSFVSSQYTGNNEGRNSGLASLVEYLKWILLQN